MDKKTGRSRPSYPVNTLQACSQGLRMTLTRICHRPKWLVLIVLQAAV